MFYLGKFPDDPPGFNTLSTSADWVGWLIAAVPAEADLEVKRRLQSNLKHILVGLEMKAGLVMPHGKRVVGKSVLFEPYCQIMIFEFCVGVFSVCEGLGSIHHLLSKGKDGAAAPRVAPDDWIAALCSEFDPIGVHDLKANVRHTKEVRDKIHQDRIGARADIDWHDFGYDKAFIPARDALQPLLRQFEDQVPKTTNLLI
jgi:hypothetical protein